MLLPDPDLIKSCCHHLLFLIPLQYLYLRPPSDKGGGGEEMLLLPAGGSWLAGRAVARRHLLLAVLQHLLLFLTFPACCGVRFLPKVGRPRSLSIRHCPPRPFPRCRPRYRAAGLCWLLSVIRDIVSLGNAINPFPSHQDIQLSPAGEAD